MTRATSPPSRSAGARLRRGAWRWRHAVAAVCLAGAASVAIGELSPPPPTTTTAVALSTDLPAGHVLGRGDVGTRDLPVGDVPAGAPADVEAVVGRPLAVRLTEGTVLGEGMLAGAGVAAAPGEVVVAVLVADDGSAHLAEPGLRVSLLAPPTDGGPAEVVAENVLVLGAVEDEEGGLLGGGDESDVTRMYVSATPDTATLLVGSSAWTPLSVVLGPS
ncbi:SAF domain-containing protein [Georgenia sp. Z1344]|uniref:SAF domain-containing protein n=1 Tax=Georgenia sp. Z1344 TaxID=3416706 RepID=UPI003CF605DA